MLQFIGLPRISHDLATEQQQIQKTRKYFQATDNVCYMCVSCPWSDLRASTWLICLGVSASHFNIFKFLVSRTEYHFETQRSVSGYSNHKMKGL